MFSITAISPSHKLSKVVSKSSPLVWGIKYTGVFTKVDRCLATILNEFFFLSSSVLTLPKWDNKITLAFFSTR